MAFPASVEMTSALPPPPKDDSAPTLPSHQHQQPDKTWRPAPGSWWQARHTLAIMANLGIAASFMIRTSLPVAIVAMVGTTVSNESLSEACPSPDDADTPEQSVPGDFRWDEKTQGFILGSFYYGYAVSHLPGGRFGEVYGGRLAFGAMMTLASVCCLLSPLCASTSTGLFIAIWVLMGLLLGGLYPTLNCMIPSWFPPEERPKFTTIIFAGNNLGTVVGMPLTGWLCGTGWLGGWPAPFYVIGTIGLVWSAAWFLLVHSHPEDHPRISQQELDYILSGRGNVKEKKAVRVPWAAMLSSPWVWVVTLVATGDSYGFYTLLTEIPTYLSNIQHITVSNTGLVASLPYLVSVVVSLCWGLLVGWLAASDTLSTKRIRQLSMSVAYYVPAVCLVGMCLVGCKAGAAVALLSVGVGANACIYAGVMSSHQDLAPNLAGTLMGLTNTFSSLMGVVAPAVTGAIINHNQSLGAWRAVFLIAVTMYVSSCTLFIIFTPVKLQPWNFPPPRHPPPHGQDSAPSTS